MTPPVPGMVVAVIPTYEPSPHVIEVVQSLIAQVAAVVVYDDGTTTTTGRDTLDALTGLGVRVVRGDVNMGIARGLNTGLAYAVDVGAEWLFTVDQDSDVPAGLVAGLVHAAAVTRDAGVRVGAVGVETIVNTSGPMRFPTKAHNGVMTTAELMQSGTLWSVSALQAVGRFNETFRMDAVDAAACLRLREHGYLLVVAPGTNMRHDLGVNARQVNIFGHTVIATGHSPARRETMVRNRLRLLPAEFRQSPVQAFRALRRVTVNAVLAVTVEDDRWAKTKGIARGIRTAFVSEREQGASPDDV